MVEATAKVLSDWIVSYGPVALLLAAITGAYALVKFLMIRKREQHRHEFDAFHSLIKQLVQGDEKGEIKLDRQLAVVYELANFQRYFPITQRILNNFRARTVGVQGGILTAEIDRTLSFIAAKQSWMGSIPLLRPSRN